MQGQLAVICHEVYQSEKLRHGSAKIDKVHRFRDVVAKACRDALVLNIGHDVGRECNDR